MSRCFRNVKNGMASNPSRNSCRPSSMRHGRTLFQRGRSPSSPSLGKGALSPSPSLIPWATACRASLSTGPSSTLSKNMSWTKTGALSLHRSNWIHHLIHQQISPFPGLSSCHSYFLNVLHLCLGSALRRDWPLQAHGRHPTCFMTLKDTELGWKCCPSTRPPSKKL